MSSEAVSLRGCEAVSCDIRDLSEISRGGRGWKQRDGHNFLRLQRREGS